MATGTLPNSDGVIVEGILPKDQPEDSDQSDTVQIYAKRQIQDIPFEKGGPPLMIEQLESLSMDFFKSHDTGHKDEPQLKMEDGTLRPLIY
eukprot:3039539-Pleurochrysis_carterae.AAC.1